MLREKIIDYKQGETIVYYEVVFTPRITLKFLWGALRAWWNNERMSIQATVFEPQLVNKDTYFVDEDSQLTVHVREPS